LCFRIVITTFTDNCKVRRWIGIENVPGHLKVPNEDGRKRHNVDTVIGLQFFRFTKAVG
jgi:hypothetical protein